ncbi:MAG: hypothetical protein SXQ77_06415, partial [Halobacteria archaeon]|nr:hypothetical protein [Halobacteria archaeon]
MSVIHIRFDRTGKQALLVVGLIAVVVLAGCLGGGSSDVKGNSSELDDAEQGLPVQDISWNGGTMVVQLKSGHNIKKMNLIAPDGSLYARSSFATGETKASFQLLSYDGGYPAGEYKLVAVKEDGSKLTEKVELRPNLRIVEVYVMEGENTTSLSGKKINIPRLAVTVENTGTSPASMYNIDFKNTPEYREKEFDYDNRPSQGRPFE